MNKPISSNACLDCPAHHEGNLLKLGIDMQNWDYVVAMAGNPNTGKSTVFNALTGLRQHTGNWPGKTVVRAEGGFVYQDHRYKLVDLPGTYSLLSTSPDEEVARNFVLFGKPDVTVVVVDATRLERNLNLALQIMEITDRTVICLNLMDQARSHNLKIDDRRLARDLGVPVIPTSARYDEGIPQLLQAIESESLSLKGALSQLVDQIQILFPELPNSRWVALRLLDGDRRIIEAILEGELENLGQNIPPILNSERDKGNSKELIP